MVTSAIPLQFDDGVSPNLSCPDSPQSFQQSHFMRLPCEIRQLIYTNNLDYSLLQHRVPYALHRAVYYENLSDAWTDQPSPLLLLNKRILCEVSDVLQHIPVILRVTGQGMAFDSAGLSACIARDVHGDYGRIPHLVVEVWPPHADRPVEMLYIWDHMRRL